MINYPTKVYRQAIIVLNSSSVAPDIPPPPTKSLIVNTTFSSVPNIWEPELNQGSTSAAAVVFPITVLYPGSLGNYAHTMQLNPSVTDFVDAMSPTKSLILKTTFSSVPIIWESELNQEYQELGAALSEMTELEEGDEWKIDEPVYSAACYVAAGLMANSFPAPRIFNHGPKSVVFNWSHEADNLYLTISADQISALISSPDRIKRRIDYSVNELMNPSLALSSIRAAYSEKSIQRLITGTVSAPPEIVG
jgi:hypothetical protein